MEIAGEIRAEMARQQITVGELAEKSDLNRVNLSRKLNGHRDFLFNEVSNIAKALSVPLSTLVKRTEENAPAA